MQGAAAGPDETHVVAEIAAVGSVVHTGLVVLAAVAVVVAAHQSEQEEVEVEMVHQFPCGKTVVIGVSLASAGW